MAIHTNDISLTELLNKIQLERERVEKDLSKQKGYLTGLQNLKEKFTQNPDLFDNEDIGQIEIEIENRSCKIEVLDAEYKRISDVQKEKHKLFEVMQNTIQQRSEVLEKDNECLTAHPEMTKYFAKKQNKLRNMLIQSLDIDGKSS